MVPADSDRISRVPSYSGFLLELQLFRLQDFHLLRFSFPTNSTIIELFSLYKGPTTPLRRMVWAFPFSLATTKRIDFFLSFPPVT